MGTTGRCSLYSPLAFPCLTSMFWHASSPQEGYFEYVRASLQRQNKENHKAEHVQILWIFAHPI